MNKVKTAMLLATMTALFVMAGDAFGGRIGMILAFGCAVVTNFSAYWYSDKIALRLLRARELRPPEAPELFQAMKRLTANAGLVMPRIYVASGT